MWTVGATLVLSLGLASVTLGSREAYRGAWAAMVVLHGVGVGAGAAAFSSRLPVPVRALLALGGTVSAVLLVVRLVELSSGRWP